MLILNSKTIPVLLPGLLVIGGIDTFFTYGQIQSSPPVHGKMASNQATRPNGVIVADYPADGVILGSAWNSIEGHKLDGTCIDAGRHDDTGQQTYSDITNVTENSELNNEFQLSMSAKYAGGTTSISGKYKFADKVQITDDKDYFAADVQVINGAHYLVAPAMSAAETRIIRPEFFSVSTMTLKGSHVHLLPDFEAEAVSDPDQFSKDCGDSFVSAIHDGAELAARLEFDVHSQREKQTLNDELNASFLGVDLTVKADQTLESNSKSSKLKILYYKSGGSGDPIPGSKQELLMQLKDLANAAKTSPHAFEITIERYDNLYGWPKTAKLPVYRNVDSLAAQYAKLKTLSDIIYAVKKSPEEYILGHGVSIDSLNTLQTEIGNRLISIQDSIRRCRSDDPSACKLQGEDATPDYAYRIKLPVRRNSFDEDVTLNTNVDDLPALESWVADRNKLCDAQKAFSRGQRNNCDYQNDINAKLLYIEAVKKAISDEKSRYPSDLRRAIADQWILLPAATRCKHTFEQSCSPAEQEKWVQQIITN